MIWGTSLITSFKMTTGLHLGALVLLELLAFLPLASAVASENKFRFEIDNKDGSYQAFLSDKLWFNSGPVAFRNNGKWFSTDDGSLKLHNHSKSIGQDAWGEYKAHEVWWQTTDCLCYLLTRFNVYQHESVVSFASVFASGAVHAAANNTDNITSAFPTFLIEELGLQRAYLTYNGSFAADIHIDKWSPSSPPPGGIDGGLPLVLFDSDMQNTVVISPLSGFMSAGQETWEPKNKQPLAFSLGLLGTIDTIPPLYEYKSFMVAGDNITRTMQKWGELLRKQSGKDDSYRKTDHTLNYLGYWTDHGSCYWYNTGEYKNYEELLVAVKENADFEGIPFGYLQLDSWWYYKGLRDGVKNWTAMTGLFPSGIDAVVKKTGWPIMAHNRYWSSKTDYAKQNGGKFDFVVEGDLALPNDPNFWHYLLSMGQADWGLQVYEQDWLYVQYSGMKDILGSLFLGESWLKEMGLAAQELGLTIQYCMPWTRHMMASVEIPVVTQVRVSGDYQPGSKQWMVGDTAILAHALGLASFKDTFQTGAVESHCATKTTETHPILETYIAALSGGPVGIGDAIGNFNKTLILATCMTDGRLLKPTHPALSIDASFLFRAFGGDGPDGPVYVAYTEVTGYTWYHILAVDLDTQYSMNASQLPPTTNTWPQSSVPYSIAFRKDPMTNKVVFAINYTYVGEPLHLGPCGQDDFQYWSIAPLLKGTLWALFGELDKAVTVSETRFTEIASYGSDVTVHLVGVPGETVNVALFNVFGASPVIVTCKISSTGTAVLHVDGMWCGR